MQLNIKKSQENYKLYGAKNKIGYRLFFVVHIFSVSLAFHQVAEKLVLQILGLATFTIFCSWLSRILSLVFHKIQILVNFFLTLGILGLVILGLVFWSRTISLVYW